MVLVLEKISISLVSKEIGLATNSTAELITKDRIGNPVYAFNLDTGYLTGKPYWNIFSAKAPGYWKIMGDGLLYKLNDEIYGLGKKYRLSLGDFRGYHHEAKPPKVNDPTQDWTVDFGKPYSNFVKISLGSYGWYTLMTKAGLSEVVLRISGFGGYPIDFYKTHELSMANGEYQWDFNVDGNKTGLLVDGTMLTFQLGIGRSGSQPIFYPLQHDRASVRILKLKKDPPIIDTVRVQKSNAQYATATITNKSIELNGNFSFQISVPDSSLLGSAMQIGFAVNVIPNKLTPYTVIANKTVNLTQSNRPQTLSGSVGSLNSNDVVHFKIW